MSLRGLIQSTQRRATTLGLSASHTDSIIYRNLSRRANSQIRLPRHEACQRLTRPYSNFAPGGLPEPYYGHTGYHQPPKRRFLSRLKDMFFGSIITVVAYTGYTVWLSWDMWKHEQHEQKAVELLNTIQAFNGQLIADAEAEDDGSEESAQRIRELFLGRIRVLMVSANELMKPGESQLFDIGPLYRFPEAHSLHGTETIKDEDTTVFAIKMPVDHDRMMAESAEEHGVPVTNHLILGVYARCQDLDLGPYKKEGSDLSQTKFEEVMRRLGYMVETLYKQGVFEHGTATSINLTLRDKTIIYYHDGVEMHIYDLV